MVCISLINDEMVFGSRPLTPLYGQTHTHTHAHKQKIVTEHIKEGGRRRLGWQGGVVLQIITSLRCQSRPGCRNAWWTSRRPRLSSSPRLRLQTPSRSRPPPRPPPPCRRRRGRRRGGLNCCPAREPWSGRSTPPTWSAPWHHRAPPPLLWTSPASCGPRQSACDVVRLTIELTCVDTWLKHFLRRLLPDNLCILLVLAFAVPPFAKHDGRVHIGRGEGVRLIEQRDHTEQDGPDDGGTAHAQTGNEDSQIRSSQCIKKRRWRNSAQAFWNCNKLHPSSDRGVTSSLSSCGSITCCIQSAQVLKDRLSTLPQVLNKTSLADAFILKGILKAAPQYCLVLQVNKGTLKLKMLIHTGVNLLLHLIYAVCIFFIYFSHFW